MLSFFVVSLSVGISLRHPQAALVRKADTNTTHKLDPHCSEGIMNTEMTFCCQADCGECSDTSDLCDAARADAANPSGRESTCCPAAMEAAKVPSCENSMAPCAIPLSVRNPPDVSDITAADRHAKDDCGEAKPATEAAHHLATAYIKFEGKSIGASTSDCGNYADTAQAAAACSGKDDCMGFAVKSDGAPDCLYTAGTEIEQLSDASQDLYLKREDAYTGKTYKLSLGKCSVECGGGTTPVLCKTEGDHGVEVKLGMCSTQVAMNADAMLEGHACHMFPCGLEHVSGAAVAQVQCTGCQEIVEEYYYYKDVTEICEDIITEKSFWYRNSHTKYGQARGSDPAYDYYYYYSETEAWDGAPTDAGYQEYKSINWAGNDYVTNVTFVCSSEWADRMPQVLGPTRRRWFTADMKVAKTWRYDTYYYLETKEFWVQSDCAC